MQPQPATKPNAVKALVEAHTVAAFGDAVSALGTKLFDTVLLAAIESAVVVDSLAAVTFKPGIGIQHLSVASRNNLASARSMTRDYVGLHHQADPNYDALTRRRRGVLVQLHDPRRLNSSTYESRFFSKSGAVDKVAYIWWVNDIGYYVNLYRLTPSALYTEGEVALLRSLAPLVASLFGAHGRRQVLQAALGNRDPKDVANAIIDSIGTRLSDRERAVLSRTLLGIRTEGISLDLKVKPTTVVTQRKRAYAKLGIASQAELFALCLQCLPRLAGT